MTNNLFIISTVLLMSNFNSAFAHNESEAHIICQSAKDYNGCIQANQFRNGINVQEGINNWRVYGPLIINWSAWRKKENNYITSSLYSRKDQFYLAINCEKKKINVTDSNLAWKGWDYANYNFEKTLIKDYCYREQ